MTRLPLHLEAASLQAEDIDLFADEFARAAAEFLPLFSGTISCFALPPNEPGDTSSDIPDAWAESIRQVGQRCLPVTEADASLVFMPIWGNADVIGVMVFEAMESALVERMSEEWLLDRSHLIARELRLRKQLAIDPVTGLLNVRHFRDSIFRRLNPEPIEPESPSDVPLMVIILLEIYPRAAAAAKALDQIGAAAALLQITLKLPGVHHLGCGVFGLAWQGLDEQQAMQAGKNLLVRLKQANVQRARLGLAVSRADTAAPPVSAEDLLVHAWQALQVACRRGPFGLCSYNSIDRPDSHPLCRPSKSVRSKLARQWRHASSFALVLLQQDDADAKGIDTEQMTSLLDCEEGLLHPVGNNEWYAYLDGSDLEAAVAWAKKAQAKFRTQTTATLSAGIAAYPCIDYTKSAVLMNAKKALLHTRFYGPHTVTRFDGLSLNVSGDIYYDEGDLVRAAREYRKGLILDPDNINLLNSLGEVYARMNRHRQAAALFDQALKKDKTNYMALFNLGLANRKLHDDLASTACFEQALAVWQQHEATKSADETAADGSYLDLCMQLGRLYCQANDHAKAIPLLELASQPGQDGRTTGGPGSRDHLGRGGALRYLGDAYAALGRVTEAMATLQRAVRFNPRDGASLSLLGELYARDNQGDEIALSICQKAVELDPKPYKHWQRLGWIKLRLQDPTGALVALRTGLRRQKNNVDILSAMAEAYEMRGSKRRAARVYARVLRLQPNEPRAAAALKQMLSAT